jgi:hypothetical protein
LAHGDGLTAVDAHSLLAVQVALLARCLLAIGGITNQGPAAIIKGPARHGLL